MTNYDFQQLSPHDLELLARDILQADWGITLENFKSGKDGGIDLRFATGKEKIIVQCKHYFRTGLNGLLRDLKKEKAKVRQLKPSRYVLVTSVPLSPPNKADIIKIIGARFLKSGDVIGCEGLNNLIGRNPEIERKHFKLWLASRTVLDRVIHNAAIARSEFRVRQVYQDARRYVQSDAFPRALTMLDENNLAIVSGPPGVGKTTLANLLLYTHVEKGYKPIIIERDIEEGQNLFQEGEKQIFYFDDFMGATFLGEQGTVATSKNDHALLGFIAMVRATPTARLILTTREHIYSQAMNRSERLRHSDLDDLRVFLRISSYSFAQKARILYNHLYFSDLPKEYTEEMLRDRFYLKIIKHEKFNPRIIEWLSSFQRVRDVPVNRYQAFVKRLLRDPSEIWRHAYEQEVSNAARSMLLTIFSFGGQVRDTVLRTGFAKLHTARARKYGFVTQPEDFRLARREIAGSFIKPWGTQGIEVLDPSVLDLMNAIVRKVPENAVDIVGGASRFDQVERIWKFAHAEQGRQILSSFADNADVLVSAVKQCMFDIDQKDFGVEMVRYHSTSIEGRLAVIIDMADDFPNSLLSQLIGPFFDRMLEGWGSDGPDITDGIELLRSIEHSRSMPHNDAAERKEIICSALLTSVQDGCASHELREIIVEFHSPEGIQNSIVRVIESAFDKYYELCFYDEVHDCRSSDQFDRLRDDLEFLGEKLKLDIDWLLNELEDARDEFETREEQAAEHMMDEWKDRWRETKTSEQNIFDMFGSLR